MERRLVITGLVVTEQSDTSDSQIQTKFLKNIADNQRPTFFIDQQTQMVAIFVDKELFGKIGNLIEDYKTSKSFGILQINKIWKIVEPLLNKSIDESITHEEKQNG